MTVLNLRRLEALALADRAVSHAEADSLVKAANDLGSVDDGERAELRSFMTRVTTYEPGARELLERASATAVLAPAPTQVLTSVAGFDPASFDDDAVVLGPEGTVHGEANVPAYTRGYDAIKDGPLRFRHGSAAPASNVLTANERSALANSPGQALDAAARVFGARVNGFEAMAHSPNFFNPSAEYWWGKCHAWAWSALSETVSRLVDVPGPDGARGLWVGGQFVSRADLGNWLMAVGDTISVRDSNALFKSHLSALELLKGTSQFMMNGGGGVVADIFNDEKRGKTEVWNQPFVSADVTTKTVGPETAQQLLDVAVGQGLDGTAVKWVSVTGTYAVERGDGHEGEPGRTSKSWNLYVVTDSSGRALTAYMADDPALKAVAGLPTTVTDEVPEYFWRPTLRALTDTLDGRSNSVVATDPHGGEFKFLVGTVLRRGVPAATRTAFEAELAALPAGRVDPSRVTDLALRYPGIANAYSPQQWVRAFSSRGLDAGSFGAAWPLP